MKWWGKTSSDLGGSLPTCTSKEPQRYCIKKKEHDVFFCALFTCLFLLSFFHYSMSHYSSENTTMYWRKREGTKVPTFGRWSCTFWYNGELMMGQLLAELPHSAGGVWVSFVQDFLWGLYENIRLTVDSNWRGVDAMRPVMTCVFLPLNQRLPLWTPSPRLGRRGGWKKMDGYFTFTLQ